MSDSIIFNIRKFLHSIFLPYLSIYHVFYIPISFDNSQFSFYLKIESTSFTPLWISNWIGLCIIHRFDIYYINESCFVWWCRFLSNVVVVTYVQKPSLWQVWQYIFDTSDIFCCQSSLTGENETKYSTKTLITLILYSYYVTIDFFECCKQVYFSN